MTYRRLHGIDFHVESGRAWSVEDGQEVGLSAARRLVLAALLQANGNIVTYEEITEMASGTIVEDDASSAQQFIYEIRRRLKDISPSFEGIATASRGYRVVYEEVTNTPPEFVAALGFGPPAPQVATSAVALKAEPAEVVAELEKGGRGSHAHAPTGPRLRGAAFGSLIRRYAKPPHIDALHRLKGSILEVGERIYPVAVFPAASGQALEAVLPPGNVDARRAWSAMPDAMATRDPLPRIGRWLAANPDHSPARAERETASGWNLAMTRLYRDGDEIRMTANLAEYGLILDTCDALIDEAFMTGVGVPSWSLRDAVERDEVPFESAFFRAAGIGVAALITVVDRDDERRPVLRALVGRRSANVGTYADTWHVAPAGMLNWRFSGGGPHDDDTTPWAGYEPEDVLRSVLTEYAEELRDIRRMELNRRREVLDSLPAVSALKRHARFEFTGVAMDLANLRPEICVLIYLEQPRSFRLNYEYGTITGPTGDLALDRERRKLLPITIATASGPVDHDALHILDPAETVPSGAAAFWLGVERARELFYQMLRRR
ncbi:MAG: hypothetical protein R3C29_13150 [Dehalococcoidia bacterium]